MTVARGSKPVGLVICAGLFQLGSFCRTVFFSFFLFFYDVDFVDRRF